MHVDLQKIDSTTTNIRLGVDSEVIHQEALSGTIEDLDPITNLSVQGKFGLSDSGGGILHGFIAAAVFMNYIPASYYSTNPRYLVTCRDWYKDSTCPAH